jgi:hypothetical protein
MVIDPILAPHVVEVVEVVTGKVVTLLNVTVSELTSGDAVQELNVVLITYCVEGTAGGQILGNVISSIPGVVVAVSALAMKVPLSVYSLALTKLDVPPFGVKRYPVFDSLHCVQFLPGAAANFVLVSSWIPKIPKPAPAPLGQVVHKGLFVRNTSIKPVLSCITICEVCMRFVQLKSLISTKLTTNFLQGAVPKTLYSILLVESGLTLGSMSWYPPMMAVRG